MTSKFEEMGHKFGDKFEVVSDYDGLKVGDIVVTIKSESTNTVQCIKEGDNKEYAMYFSGPYDIEVIPYKEESTVVSKTNTLNVGESGSPRYEVIRKVLAVLDGDEVRVDEYCGYKAGDSRIEITVNELRSAVKHQTICPYDYQLKSEQLPVLSEKDLKIKELEDNIKSMKKNLEELKGM